MRSSNHVLVVFQDHSRGEAKGRNKGAQIVFGGEIILIHNLLSVGSTRVVLLVHYIWSTYTLHQ